MTTCNSYLEVEVTTCNSYLEGVVTTCNSYLEVENSIQWDDFQPLLSGAGYLGCSHALGLCCNRKALH